MSNKPPIGDIRHAGHIRAGQSGVVLLEALIAILIFSLGILTIVGIQATSIRMAGDAQLRTKATLLANRLVGEMWVQGGTIAALKTAYETGGSAYNAWLADVSAQNGLPGVVAAGDDVVSTLPTVTVSNEGEVVVTLFWRTPSMRTDEPGHQHIVITQISRNPT